jgi:hypothetical protein
MTVTQRVEDELQLAPGRSHGTDVTAAAVSDPLPQHPGHGAGGTFLTDSIAAQWTRREPRLVIRPRWTWVSDSWCLGVSPAQQVSFGAEANGVMSPISATNTAARVGPIPGMFWTAVYPGS